MRILLTSTSFQDTPGDHHRLLNEQGFHIDMLRGPLKAEVLLPIIHQYEGIICGDDEYTREVLTAGKNGRLKVVSKYGIGLDKINLAAAAELGIRVTNCPGVNHTTVAEHVFALLLSYCKHIPDAVFSTRQGEWTRHTGIELLGKRIGIIGLGKIGKEVALRARAFAMQVHAFDQHQDMEFNTAHQIQFHHSVDTMIPQVDIISLHLNLQPSTHHIINRARFDLMKEGVILINTARGELVDQNALIAHLDTEKKMAYLTDVLNEEPMPPNHPLHALSQVFITPHVGSRTFESVVRQGSMAVNNLISNLKN